MSQWVVFNADGTVQRDAITHRRILTAGAAAQRDFAAINLGQLKNTFAIRLDSDGDSDGLSGPTGEISNAALAAAISAALDSAALDSAAANSSANTNAVTTLDAPFANDPPSLADMDVLRAKLNELISALRR